MAALILGTVIFSEWELPDKIPFGGAQQLAIHKMMGGKRVIDAMGADDGDIDWQGRFLGFAAELRARRIDLMRRSGRPVVLTWRTFLYRVVIQKFRVDFRTANHLTYGISLEVVEDIVASRVGPALQRAQDAVMGGLADAFGVAVDHPVLVGGVTAAQTAATTVLLSGRGFSGLGTAVMGGLQAATAGAIATAATTGVAAGSAMSTSSGAVVAGGEPGAMAAAVTQTSEAATLGVAAQRTAAYSGSVASTLATIPQ